MNCWISVVKLSLSEPESTETVKDNSPIFTLVTSKGELVGEKEGTTLGEKEGELEGELVGWEEGAFVGA